MNYQEAIEKLTVYFTTEQYQAEVLQAKREFFGDVGIDDKESDRYEQWMNIFFDWYLFSRKLSGLNIPPAQLAREIDEFQQLAAEDKELFTNLAQCEYSLLEFVKVKKDYAYFKDLFRKRKCAVALGEYAIPLEKGNICDARLIPEGDHFQMTKGLCVHPLSVNRFILKEVKALKKSTEDEQAFFQMELIRMFFKMEQYSHLSLDQVYTRDSKVRF